MLDTTQPNQLSILSIPLIELTQNGGVAVDYASVPYIVNSTSCNT